MKTRKKKNLLKIAIFSMLFVLMLALGLVAYAYFSTRAYVVSNDGKREYARLGMELNTFFDVLTVDNGTDLNIPDKTEAADADGNYTTYTFNSSAEWGSAENPYIISELRHLRNLSVLQNIGYFNSYTDNFGEDGYEPEDCMPYFLVCEPDGTPVVIDGTDMAEAYEPIGNDDNPFIGYVGGAFIDGETCEVGGKTVDQSVIYNVDIQPAEDFVDVGLFGHIGYLGEEGEDTVTEFDGAAATVTDLTLYDVKISVDDSSKSGGWWKRVAEHLFNYESDSTTSQEDHHIGIFAGHVEYATVSYISVYYSSDEVVAIDLSHVKTSDSGANANYLSTSGIIGFVHQMNSTSEEGKIHKDGTSNDDISVSSGGVGTGGGLLSGSGRGYVTAKEVFDQYNECGTVANYTINDVEFFSLLVIADGTYGSAESYSLQDGTEVTMGTENGETVAQIAYQYQRMVLTRTEYCTWTDFVVRYGTEDNYTYYHKNKTLVTGVTEDSGIYLRFAAQYDSDAGEWKALCTQYVRDRIISGTKTTDRYYFYDGVFTFALSSADDTVEETDLGEIQLGETSDEKWAANVAEGNHSIAAYLKQVTSTTQLQAAATNNTPVFIMYQDGDSNYIVTLAENSEYVAGDGEDALFTSWTKLNWMDSTSSDSLKNAFSNDAIYTSQITGNLNSVSNENLVSNWSDYKILDVGTATDSLTLDQLRTHYSVDVEFEAADSSQNTYYKDDGTNKFTDATVTSGSAITETRYQTYNGYYYYIYSTTRWRYYYVDSNGTEYALGSRTSSTPNNYLTHTYGTDSAGYTLYSYGSYSPSILFRKATNGEEYYVTTTTEWFPDYDDYTEATVSDGTAIVPYTYSINYFVAEVKDEGTTYKYNGTTTVSEPEVYSINDVAQTETVNGNTYTLYKSGNYIGIKLIIYDISGYYTFGNNSSGTQYYLRILSRNYTFNTRYSLMCSTDTYATTRTNFTYQNFLTPTVANSTLSSVTFNSDGSCNIAYTLNGNTRYLAYYDSYFHGTTSTGDSTKLYIYTVEGTQDVSYGRITFDPTSGSDSVSLSAENYVLWPDTEKNATTTYTIKQLQQTGVTKTVTDSNNYLTTSAGWKSNSGSALEPTYLSKQFCLNDGISEVSIYNLWNGNISLDSDSKYVKAPIGTTGEEAYIPSGCVAFRVNKSGENQKIRIIVAVPQTDYYRNESDTNGNTYATEDGQLDYETDYIFGMWKISEANENTSNTINISTAETYYYLPRSAKYAPGTAVTEANPTAITVNYNGTSYRSYLNGENVLVAMEFSCSEEGVYLLGSNLQCDIVYFSADATASSGNDGETSYKMGTIDYVYSNDTQILTVKDVDTNDKTADGYTKNYSAYYYQSYVVLYTENNSVVDDGDTDTYTVGTVTYPNVNDVQIKIRRLFTTGDETPTITWKTAESDKNYVIALQYNLNSDELEERTS